MRKFFLVLVMMMFCSAVKADKLNIEEDITTYKSEMQKCDNIFIEERGNAITTYDTYISSSNAADCYYNIIEKIVAKHYSKNIDEIKPLLDNYIKSINPLSQSIYMSADYCYPQCGSINGSISSDSVLDKIKSLANEYINSLRMGIF